MPRPKRITVVAHAPAHSAEAITKWQDGIEAFMYAANLARTGETSDPVDVQLDAALTEFSRGCFPVPFKDLAGWAVAAGRNILALVRDSHWHLRACAFCNRWLLAKDQRRLSCRRVDCLRAVKAQRRAAERKARRDLDRGATVRAQRTF